MDVLEDNRHLLFNYLLLASEDDFFFFIAKSQEEKKMFFFRANHVRTLTFNID